MADWIAISPDLLGHPKFKRLLRLLGYSKNEGFGLLYDLWSYAYRYAPDGDLTRLDRDELGDACRCEPGSLDEVIAALTKSGFLDDDGEHLTIHDWEEWGGRQHYYRANGRAFAKKHRYDSAVVSEVRERDGDFCRYCGRVVDWLDRRGGKGGTYDHVDPKGPSTFDNLVVSCRSCNSTKRDRTLERAKMQLLPPRSPQARSRTVLEPSKPIEGEIDREKELVLDSFQKQNRKDPDFIHPLDACRIDVIGHDPFDTKH